MSWASRTWYLPRRHFLSAIVSLCRICMRFETDKAKDRCRQRGSAPRLWSSRYPPQGRATSGCASEEQFHSRWSTCISTDDAPLNLFTMALVRTDFSLQMQTIVSISTRTIHDNPDLFPEPGSFKPERWLGEKGKELERWNVAFSKGTRNCIGIK